ncbi:MAG: c-type cytochrome [Chromatocurvus sp.]
MFKQLSAMFILASLALSSVAVELTEEQRAAIEARLKPHGDLCVTGDSACAGAAVAGADASSGGGISGESVYNQACVACHSSGAAGAPIVGQVDQWSERIAKGREALHESGIKGVAGTSMMAKGGRADLSDEQVMAAVDYMVDNSQ